MGIRVALHHKTEYLYDRLATLSPQIVRLRPAVHSRTPVLSYSLRIEPKEYFINWQQDPQGNFLARLVFPSPTRNFSVEVELVAEMTVINPFDFFIEPGSEQFPFRYEEALQRELRPFLETEPAGPALQAYLDGVNLTPQGTMDFLVEQNMRLQKDIAYLIRMEPGVQTPEVTLETRSGSCRDSAWLLVQLLRHLGLAARFVSGYLIQLRPDVKPLEGPAGPAQDFTDLHAWAEVYIPGAGWVGLDPTSGLLADEGHIPLAATPEPLSAAPVSGGVSPCEVEFEHTMSVTRVHEDPRVTKPYSEEQWERICALGERVDEELTAGDVRLTMGGEPTFVSIDDMDGEEWNTAAVGPNKQRLAGDLVTRLRDHFAPGGFLHFGQGKWYPGEPLPRWAFTCFWRTDGIPLWRDTKWVADPAHDYGYKTEDAQLFAETLARRLEVLPDYIVTAYEDPYEYLHREELLPRNVDPEDNKLESPEDRDRMRRIFERGLAAPAGFVLPLQRVPGKSGPEWQSGLWMLRARHLYLMPGDSPIGLRLPLPSLLWEPPSQAQQIWEVDPMAPRGALPVPRRIVPTARPTPLPPRQVVREQITPPPTGAPGPVVRTALAVEARNGRVHVFMPPVASADDYVDMIAAVEDTAASLEMPILVEGYTPPFDPRLQQIKVTPDPGVIEVNVHPAASWKELVHNTTTLYEEARQCRLGTEKFMLDGRHTGTGGGNHVVLGAANPADSPFLRRPDLLKSLIAYWLNHPALSYLFSSVFVGPTSQAPRIDETRADAVYELEIAMNLLQPGAANATPPWPGATGAMPPWVVDRIFRNLLVDVTGNTHRAEFCIDKLYSPDSATGRLGLLEMRAFEMPPHARMSLTQQLLVRALVAWFWRQPFAEKPIRWGTRLHDMFLLPHFVERDLGRVISDLQKAGYAMETNWFSTHMEFRFPVYGRVCYDGMQIELRQAIEPWYVLGEEPGAGGTTRFVDSSVERLQVKVQGLISERYQVTCNGRRLPLLPTGTQGEFVCGVRYRAWQPPRCLHPTIPPHAPLIFDLLDTAASRSIGGCTYFVAHPGGRNYETFPVNANEAESRRVARFYSFGHTPGPMSTPPPEDNPEFPTTLDLRR
ncbi:MAG: transglutaminase family protein [Bryobacterales bacterium]|nr:transglutaminase family protein [Bryobacterales bacterium]